MPKALEERQRRADAVLALDDAVATVVAALRERGMQSPYLRNFVLARSNPLRFRRGATLPFDEAVEKTLAAVKKIDPAKVRPQDLASAGGPPEEAAN
jgi:ParB family chromosome partitioning protein